MGNVHCVVINAAIRAKGANRARVDVDVVRRVVAQVATFNILVVTGKSFLRDSGSGSWQKTIEGTSTGLKLWNVLVVWGFWLIRQRGKYVVGETKT